MHRLFLASDKESEASLCLSDLADFLGPSIDAGASFDTCVGDTVF